MQYGSHIYKETLALTIKGDANCDGTVAIADAVSNIHERIGRSSIQLMTTLPSKNRVRYIKNIVEAFFIESEGMLRPNIFALFFFLNAENAVANSTAMVVVFIPPAVEPGEPPIIINIIKMVIPASDISIKFAVLNPAVRGVTDWKNESKIRSTVGAVLNS